MQITKDSGYTFTIRSTIQAVDATAWNRCAGTHPFNQYRFLLALESSGSLTLQSGIQVQYCLLFDQAGELLACAPAMLKWGTLREYGPEKLWLRAGHADGIFSWPKFQLGIPFFPFSGPRILIRGGFSEAIQKLFLQALLNLVTASSDLSVLNLMHLDSEQMLFAQSQGATISNEVHSVWANRDFSTFNSYLAGLPSSKRYEFRKVRERALSHGFDFRVICGPDISPDLVSQYYRGHSRVCHIHAWQPWLPESAYQQIASSMPESTYLIAYFNGDQFIAGGMCFYNRLEGILYLFQWSEIEKLDGIAFDIICYRPIELAIEQGFKLIDSGLAAPHKNLRGWVPAPSFNAHWFCDDTLKSYATSVLNSAHKAG